VAHGPRTSTALTDSLVLDYPYPSRGRRVMVGCAPDLANEFANNRCGQRWIEVNQALIHGQPEQGILTATD
jgi:hypothetical protein